MSLAVTVKVIQHTPKGQQIELLFKGTAKSDYMTDEELQKFLFDWEIACNHTGVVRMHVSAATDTRTGNRFNNR